MCWKGSYLVKGCPLWIAVFVPQLFLVLHRALDEVLVHDPHERIIVVEPQLVEERLPNLIDITHDDGREEDLGERHGAVQRGLDGTVHELPGVIVEEEPAGNDGGEDNQGPERGSEPDETVVATAAAAAATVAVAGADVVGVGNGVGVGGGERRGRGTGFPTKSVV